ncbi:hypothetical protein L6R52_16695 [Myxococcota bacterium]|nr:hypothetical protein [Myxococcota bacterium]
MASLRSNLIISTIAFVLMGAIRPVFNAVVNRAFGPEVNGHAAKLIALFFLASLPATAGLPTVMVRYVSRAIGAKDDAAARGFARLATVLGAALTALGVVGALVWGLTAQTPPLSTFDAAVVAAGVAGYSYWRIERSLLLSLEKQLLALRAELVGAVVLVVGLGVAVAIGVPGVAIVAFVAVYFAFAVFTAPAVLPAIRGGAIDDAGRREFLRYTLLWFIGSGTSLAVKELAVLLVDQRADRAMVGELSVALSFLMMLALAPRVIELPLIHELAALAGSQARDRQKALTERAIDWLTLWMTAAGGAAALLAGPILALGGNVTTPFVVTSFAILAAAFTLELVITPANNLLVSEAPPWVLSSIGAGSLAIACAYWYSPLSVGVEGVVAGLAGAHVIRGLAVAAYARVVYGITVFAHPLRKLTLLAIATALTWAVHNGGLNAFVGALVFEGLLVLLFGRELKLMLDVILKRRPNA